MHNPSPGSERKKKKRFQYQYLKIQIPVPAHQGGRVSCTRSSSCISDLAQTCRAYRVPGCWQHLPQQARSYCWILSLQGLEEILLPDFLEDVSIQYLKSVRLFSKRFKLWLLRALEGFPAILQISKLKGRVPHKTQILQDEELNVATRATPCRGQLYTTTLCPSLMEWRQSPVCLGDFVIGASDGFPD